MLQMLSNTEIKGNIGMKGNNDFMYVLSISMILFSKSF